MIMTISRLPKHLLGFFKTSSKRLQDVFKAFLQTPSRRLEDVMEDEKLYFLEDKKSLR